MEMIARLRGSRVRLLVNDAASERGLCFAGISDYAAQIDALRPNMAAALAKCGAGTFPIVISHQPRAFPEAEQRRVALTLCAHSHGGQCGFRPLRWSLAGLFLPYHMGLYRHGASQPVQESQMWLRLPGGEDADQLIETGYGGER